MNDTITKDCLVCGIEYEAKSKKSKFCSEACKQRNKRDRQEVDFTKIEAEPIKEECPSPHKIDKDYFNYRAEKGLLTTLDETDYERECECGKKFKTRLELMRWCSIKCHPLF